MLEKPKQGLNCPDCGTESVDGTRIEQLQTSDRAVVRAVTALEAQGIDEPNVLGVHLKVQTLLGRRLHPHDVQASLDRLTRDGILEASSDSEGTPTFTTTAEVSP